MNIMHNSRYTTWQSAYKRGREAEGKTLNQLFTDKYSLHVDKSPQKGKKYNKSSMGDAFESWFYKPKDNDSKPDLSEAHVELKATPFKELKTKNKDGSPKYSSKERLVFNMIDYDKLIHETFNTSHFLYKNRRILLGLYQYRKGIPKSKWKMCKVILYQILKSSPSDLKIIRNDWNKIRSYVEHGDADKLNERMTNYLAACTKGQNGKSRTEQPCSSKPAKTRAFSFKSGYMTTLLRDYILNPHPKNVPGSIFHGSLSSLHNHKTTSMVQNVPNSIFKKPIKSNSIDLESFILNRINKYKGCSNVKLAKKFRVPLTKNTSKEFNYQIISAMFGLDSKHSGGIGNADELRKADIIPKTISFNYKNNNKESMSFPAFSFVDMSKEKWHESSLYNDLYNSRFLFCAFKDTTTEYKPKPYNSIFLGAIIYQFPINLINNKIRYVWEDTKDKITNNKLYLEAHDYKTKNGFYIENNFINKTQSDKNNLVVHIRPHTSYSSYCPSSNSEYVPGGIKWINRPLDHELYTDHYITKQSFWINNKFINKICSNRGLLK